MPRPRRVVTATGGRGPRLGWSLLFLALLLLATHGWAQPGATGSGTLSLSVRDTAIAEIFEMLATREHVNILVAGGVSGNLSINLYGVTLDEAIHSIAEAAGYGVERRTTGYVILKPEEMAQHPDTGTTEVRTFSIHYADPDQVATLLKNYLSTYGKITPLAPRKLVVIEDRPVFLERITGVLATLDRQPRQVLIVGKILEVTLSDDESYGVDWRRLLSIDGQPGAAGTQLLSDPTSAGLFVNLLTPHLKIALDALQSTGRVRTLSTPRLLAVENREASVIVGDRQGFRVTTTINQVTTESVQFLESGVILKVTPSIDEAERVMMQIHPEVSTGTITDGIPSQTTTEVTTQLVAGDGQTVFIGGLIKDTQNKNRQGVPLLSRIPLLGRLFSGTKAVKSKSETVVMITPYVVNPESGELYSREINQIGAAERDARQDEAAIRHVLVATPHHAAADRADHPSPRTVDPPAGLGSADKESSIPE